MVGVQEASVVEGLETRCARRLFLQLAMVEVGVSTWVGSRESGMSSP